MPEVSLREAERGIHIDLEGFVDQPPSVLGVLIESEFKQWVLDPALKEAAKAKNLPVTTFVTVIELLVDRAKKENRKIFAYSSHELTAIRKFTSSEAEVLPLYRDGRKIAKRWFNTTHYGEPLDGRSLKDFMKFLGDPAPTHFGHMKATKKLKYVRDMLAQRNTYDALTSTAKRHWTNLLKYNQWDCHALQKLMTKAAKAFPWNSSFTGGVLLK